MVVAVARSMADKQSPPVPAILPNEQRFSVICFSRLFSSRLVLLLSFFKYLSNKSDIQNEYKNRLIVSLEDCLETVNLLFVLLIVNKFMS